MAHSSLNRRRMLAWIEHCLEHDEALPTDAAIADEFGFVAIEQARTLLADLADRREIVLTMVDGARTIALPAAVPRPAPPPDRKLDHGVARIAAIVRGTPPVALPIKDLAMSGRKNITVLVATATFDRLGEQAKALGIATGRHASNLLEEHVAAGTAPPPAGKPHLTAAAIRAAYADPRGFWPAISAYIAAGAETA